MSFTITNQDANSLRAEANVQLARVNALLAGNQAWLDAYQTWFADVITVTAGATSDATPEAKARLVDVNM